MEKKNWYNTKSHWFIQNKKYLYNDLLSETFIKRYDEALGKNIYEFIPSEFDIALVEAIATEKSKYTNKKDQYDVDRTPEEKRNKQFEGCLAELAVAKFLVNIFNEDPNNVYIYDAERKDFIYRHDEEYDVKVVRNNIEMRCEIRNSWSYKTNISDFCKLYDILGTYTHESKKSEEMADFFFRPVIQLNELCNDIPSNSIELIKNKKARLFIVAACDKNQMITLGKFNKRMSRNTTKYFTTKITLLDSVDNFKLTYDNLFKNDLGDN